MVDWLYPGYANRQKREDIENGELLLQIASHLANGSKHFEVEARKHKFVEDATRRDGGFDPDGFD